MNIRLWGNNKRLAARFLPTAKKMLADAKRSSLSGFVNKWLKPRPDVLIGIRFLHGIETIFIRGLRAIARRFVNSDTTVGAFTLDACMAVDILDDTQSGWIVSAIIQPGNVINSLNIAHGNCDDQLEVMYEALPGGVSSTITLTSMTLHMGTGGIGSGEFITVKPRVWNANGNVVASGSTVVITDVSGFDMPINFTFTKGDFYYFGVEVVSINFLLRADGSGNPFGVGFLPFIEKFNGANWIPWIINIPSTFNDKQIHNVDLNFSDASYDTDITRWRVAGSIFYTFFSADLNTPLGSVLTAFTPQLFTMHFSRGTLFRQFDTMIRYHLAASIEDYGKIYIFKWTTAGILNNTVSFDLPVSGGHFITDIGVLDVEFNFSLGTITFVLTISPLTPITGTIVSGGGFLVDGFIYTVGYLRDTLSAAGLGAYTFHYDGTVKVFPRIQKVGFDSWYGQRVNTNSKENDQLGLIMPAFRKLHTMEEKMGAFQIEAQLFN